MTLFAIVLLAVSAVSVQTSDPVAVVNAFHAALAAGEGDTAVAQMAPEVIIFESGGAEMSRDEYAGGHLGGDMRFAGGTQREVTDQSHGMAGDVAWVLTRTKTTGKIGDREIDATGVETMLLRKTGSAWKIVHVHWSSRSARRQQ